MPRTIPLTLGLLVCLTAGCGGSSDMPELASVSGTVTVDGAPGSNLLVMFGPEEGRASSGYTDDQGHYELQYLPGHPGAKVGRHKVVIATPYEEEEEPEYEEDVYIEPIPPQYNTRTTLSADVVADEDNTFDFSLKLDQ